MGKMGRVLLAAAFSSLVIVPVLASSHVVRISGDTADAENQPGWMFNRDTSTATPFEFTTSAASRGRGSLYVLPISSAPADKFIGEFFMLSPLAEVESISYDFRIGSGGDASDAHRFYMSVYANFGVSPADKFYDCRYSVVPAAGSLTEFTTVTFDPTQAYPVTTRGGASASPFPCPAVPADMGAGATLRVFALNVGDTSASDATLDGYLDNVVVRRVVESSHKGHHGRRKGHHRTTVHDFEPAPQSSRDCKDGGWRGYGFRNQGQCVASVTHWRHGRHDR